MSNNIPKSHPRYQSLMTRHKITDGYDSGVTASAGLIAHGRGEAFDYLIGEKTQPFALKSIEAAAALFILSNHPVISVNGNIAAICPIDTVALSTISKADLEVNLFYRTQEREKAIKNCLFDAGATKVLGVDLGENAAFIDEIDHARRVVDPKGIKIADMVFVPLEDGDRTQALIKSGKKVITVDLNPLSRTAKSADITIVDNITRAVPLLTSTIKKLQNETEENLKIILKNYNNERQLKESILFISNRLNNLATMESK